MVNIKERLLSTNCFIDNEWLDKYVLLIENNLNKEHVKYNTAKHHIFPRSLSKRLNIEEIEDTVELKHIDHCLAHLYLSLSAKDQRTKYGNADSVWFILGMNCKKIFNPEEVEEFTKFLNSLNISYKKDKDYSIERRNSTWFNNGKEEIQLHLERGDLIPEGYVKGRLVTIDNSNTVWINNGKEQFHPKKEIALKMIEKDPTLVFGMLDRGETWLTNIRAASNKRKGTEEFSKAISDGKKKFFKEHPDFRNDGNFKPGVEPHNKGKFWVTNGVENHYTSEDNLENWINKGFHKGCTQNRKRK